MKPSRIRWWSVACSSVALLFQVHTAVAMRAPIVESAAVTTPGKFQIEFGHRLAYQPGDLRTQQEALTISRGVGTKQQIDLSMPVQVESSSSKRVLAGDLTSLYKVGSMMAFAGGKLVVGGFLRNTMPTSTASRSGGTNYTFEPGILFSELGEHSIFSLNSSALVQTGGSEMLRYGASYEYAWQKVGFFVESNGYTDFKKNGLNESARATAGLEFGVGQQWTLDVGGSKGITGEAPTWSVHTGTTVTF